MWKKLKIKIAIIRIKQYFFNKFPNKVLLPLNTGIGRFWIALCFGIIGLACLSIQYRGQLYVSHDVTSYTLRMLSFLDGRILEPSIEWPLGNEWPLGWSFLALPMYFLGLPPLYCFMILAAISYIFLIWCAGEIIYPQVGPITTMFTFLTIALEPFFSCYVWRGLSDIPFTLTIAVFLLLCTRNVTFLNSIILGATASFACHLRYPGLFLLVAIPIIQLIRCHSFYKGFPHVFIALTSFIILTTPIFIRNYLVSGYLVWTNPIHTNSIFETAISWVFFNFKASLFFSYRWLDMFKNSVVLGPFLIGLSLFIIFIVAYFTLKHKENRPLLISFLVMVMYTAAMIIPKFIVDGRYILPQFLLLLLWCVCAVEILRKHYPRLRIIILSLFVTHALFASILMSLRVYDFQGHPNTLKSIKEFSSIKSPEDKVIIVDGAAYHLFALIPDLKPIQVLGKNTGEVLNRIRRIGNSSILAVKVYGPRNNLNINNFIKSKQDLVLTPWMMFLEKLVQEFPNEFRIRFRGQYILMVDYLGPIDH